MGSPEKDSPEQNQRYNINGAKCKYRDKNKILRGILEPNKKPIYSHVYPTDLNKNIEIIKNPHSPFINVSPSIVPVQARFRMSKDRFFNTFARTSAVKSQLSSLDSNRSQIQP